MCSITDSIRGLCAPATPLPTVFPACRHGDGSTNINIRIFDKHGLVDQMATPDEVKSDLQNFLDVMTSQTGLEASAVALVSQFTFKFTYGMRSPTQTEIE